MKNTLIGLLAVVAIAILVGIWVSAKKDIVESEMETYETPSMIMNDDMMMAPEGDMMVPEMMEGDMMMDGMVEAQVAEESEMVSDVNVEVNIAEETTMEADAMAEPQA